MRPIWERHWDSGGKLVEEIRVEYVEAESPEDKRQREAMEARTGKICPYRTAQSTNDACKKSCPHYLKDKERCRFYGKKSGVEIKRDDFCPARIRCCGPDFCALGDGDDKCMMIGG